MKYKPKTVIRGPWPTSKMFSSVVSQRVEKFEFTVGDLSVQDKVLEFLRRHPMQTSKQITDAICVNKNTVKSAIAALTRFNKLAWNIRDSAEFRRARHYRVVA